jgi:hypothetical protein
LCEPLETTANGKRLVVEDSAACQKTIQTPAVQQVLKTDSASNLTWTTGANNTVLAKSPTGTVEFATINSVLQIGPVDLNNQPLTTTGTITATTLTSTGQVILAGNPTTALGAATKQYVDSADALKVSKAGDTMNGLLVLSADPTAALGAATKQYADLKVAKAGDTMTGPLTTNSTILATGNSSKIGYNTGAGGTITQGAGAKTNSVTLNRPTGIIVTDSAALAANTAVTFNLSNSVIEATDIVVVSHISGGTLGSYNFAVAPAAGNANIVIRNITAGSLSEALTLRFIVIKSVNA